jgi:hypothetical protein
LRGLSISNKNSVSRELSLSSLPACLHAWAPAAARTMASSSARRIKNFKDDGEKVVEANIFFLGLN